MGWSTAPIAPWSIRTIRGMPADFDPAPALRTNAIGNGTTAVLTVQVPPTARPGSRALVLVASSTPGAAWFKPWPALVDVD